MAMATLTSKGQITIPKEVRDALRLRTGDRLDFRVTPDGRLEVVPAHRSLASLVGIAKVRRKGLSLEDMDRAIRDRGP